MPYDAFDFSTFCKYDYIQFVIFLLKKSQIYDNIDLVNAVKKGNVEIFNLLINNRKFDFNDIIIFFSMLLIHVVYFIHNLI